MTTFSWSEHHVLGAFDSEKAGGTAEMQRVYLGDGGIADTVVIALARSGFASGWKAHLAQDRNTGEWIPTPVADATAARALSSASAGSFAVGSGGPTELRMFLGGSRSLSIEATSPVIDRLAERLVTIEAFVRELAPPELVRSPVLAMRTRPVPRMRPRRRFSYWPADSVVLAFDRGQLERCIAAKLPNGKETEPSKPRYTKDMLAELDVLASAALPTGATRTQHGTLTVLDFTPAAADVGAAAAIYERWLCGLPLERGMHPDDNEHGDPAAPGGYQLARAPEGSGVTLYNPYFYQAYSADVRDGQTITNPEKLDVLAEARRTRKLATGHQVTQVGLIVPRRDDAVALGHLVTEGTVDAVAYLHDAGYGLMPYDPNVLGESVWMPFATQRKKATSKKATAKTKSKTKTTTAKAKAAKSKVKPRSATTRSRNKPKAPLPRTTKKQRAAKKRS